MRLQFTHWVFKETQIFPMGTQRHNCLDSSGGSYVFETQKWEQRKRASMCSKTNHLLHLAKKQAHQYVKGAKMEVCQTIKTGSHTSHSPEMERKLTGVSLDVCEAQRGVRRRTDDATNVLTRLGIPREICWCHAPVHLMLSVGHPDEAGNSQRNGLMSCSCASDTVYCIPLSPMQYGWNSMDSLLALRFCCGWSWWVAFDSFWPIRVIHWSTRYRGSPLRIGCPCRQVPLQSGLTIQ